MCCKGNSTVVRLQSDEKGGSGGKKTVRKIQSGGRRDPQLNRRGALRSLAEGLGGRQVSRTDQIVGGGKKK